MSTCQKLILPIAFLSFGASGAFAQMEAVTSLGDTVWLYNDGTWEYANPDDVSSEIGQPGLPPIDSIYKNPGKFEKPKLSQNTAKSESGTYEVWFNSKKWQRTPPAKLNEEADMAFTLNGSEGFGLVIHERIEIPLAKLREIALSNAREADPNVRLVNQETRTVNGKTMLCLEMSGDIEGMKFTYLGYYYSNAKGTWQFITFTTQNLFTTIRPDFEDLLNGLVILEN